MSANDEPLSGGGGGSSVYRLVTRYVGLSFTDDGAPPSRSGRG